MSDGLEPHCAVRDRQRAWEPYGLVVWEPPEAFVLARFHRSRTLTGLAALRIAFHARLQARHAAEGGAASGIPESKSLRELRPSRTPTPATGPAASSTATGPIGLRSEGAVPAVP